MTWTTADVWTYIRKYDLPYSDFYNKGFPRLGCIGCPLARQEQRMREYKMFPRFVYASVKAIEKNISTGKSISKFFDNPYEAFYWWISEVSIKKHKMQSLFKIDYEAVIKNTFPVLETVSK